MAEICKHGINQRFCSICNRISRVGRLASSHQHGEPSSLSTYELTDVIRYLNDAQIRATYGAVAELVGGIARGIGARLTQIYSKSAEASWVVSADSGLPTGYAPNQRHPGLMRTSHIVTTGRELEQRMALWKSRANTP